MVLRIVAPPESRRGLGYDQYGAEQRDLATPREGNQHRSGHAGDTAVYDSCSVLLWSRDRADVIKELFLLIFNLHYA